MAMHDDMKEYVFLCASVILRVRAITKTHPLWQYLITPDRPRLAAVFLETDVPLLAGDGVEFDFKQADVLKRFRGRGRVIRASPRGAAVQVLEVMSLDKPAIRNKPAAPPEKNAVDEKYKIKTLPDNAKVEELLVSLIGEKIKAHDKPLTDQPDPPVVGVYHNDQAHLVAVAVVDVATANNLGAALAKIPAGAAAAAIRTKRVENEFLDNFQEILNIGASLFNSADATHVKFSKIHGPPDALPADIIALMKAPRMRKDVELTIPLYGTGRISYLLA